MGENIKEIVRTRSETLLSKFFSVQIELVSNTTHRLWSAWRRHQLMKELEYRMDDDAFLRDVGVTREQVKSELRALKRGTAK
ncbi:hypothetical protein [Enterovibrio coralii]|uniref:DUF1127 domain-containing protein n=1 Tax=Enterovibrio coralii TaxID=294935 RepID=A0A135ICU0_9GAMM|nr:hypothetical protein [Enterovibrio coralii]KXF83291.1 hypothetical protein ATN88_06325 [Enterovibrio coralii]